MQVLESCLDLLFKAFFEGVYLGLILLTLGLEMVFENFLMFIKFDELLGNEVYLLFEKVAEIFELVVLLFVDIKNPFV